MRGPVTWNGYHQGESVWILHFAAIPVELTSIVGCHNPITTLNDSSVSKKLAKQSSLPSVLKSVGCKEQWLRTAPATSDASVDVVAVCILGTCVIDEFLDRGVSEKESE